MDEASATTPQEQEVQAIKQRPSADRFGCCPIQAFPHASGVKGTGRRGGRLGWVPRGRRAPLGFLRIRRW